MPRTRSKDTAGPISQKPNKESGEAPGRWLIPPYDWVQRRNDDAPLEIEVVRLDHGFQALVSIVPPTCYGLVALLSFGMSGFTASIFESVRWSLVAAIVGLLGVTYFIQFGFRVQLTVESRHLRIQKKWWFLRYAACDLPAGRLDMWWDTGGLYLEEGVANPSLVASFGTRRAEDPLLEVIGQQLFPRNSSTESLSFTFPLTWGEQDTESATPPDLPTV